MKKLVIISRDWEVYKARFEQNKHLQTHFYLHSASQVPNEESLAVADVIIAEPDLASLYIKSCSQLKWLQSTWAGNNKLQAVDKKDYILTGVKGVFGLQMVEYILSYLLYFTRRIEDFNQLKLNKQWSQLPCKTLSEYEIGIMGLGSIGMQVANRLADFGMKVNGLSRGTKQAPDVTQYTYDELGAFLENCDFVCNLLPETSATIGLCNQAFFAHMKPGSIFINAGRGSVIDTPASVINALESHRLQAAVLDVYEQEPLPANHPYYSTCQLYLSCHTAAISDPQKVFSVFEKNAANYIAGEALLYRHDFAAGY
jgi:phosphoglycerate dehydrogenase-like enzyme